MNGGLKVKDNHIYDLMAFFTCDSDREQSSPLCGRSPFAPDGVVTREKGSLRRRETEKSHSYNYCLTESGSFIKHRVEKALKYAKLLQLFLPLLLSFSFTPSNIHLLTLWNMVTHR